MRRSSTMQIINSHEQSSHEIYSTNRELIDNTWEIPSPKITRPKDRVGVLPQEKKRKTLSMKEDLHKKVRIDQEIQEEIKIALGNPPKIIRSKQLPLDIEISEDILQTLQMGKNIKKSSKRAKKSSFRVKSMSMFEGGKYIYPVYELSKEELTEIRGIGGVERLLSRTTREGNKEEEKLEIEDIGICTHEGED